MLKVLINLFLLYLLYKLIFDFIIPIYHTTKQVKQKVNKMQQDVQEHINKQNTTAPPKPQPTSKKNDDYIDYEDVK
jgi:hypothetical protein